MKHKKKGKKKKEVLHHLETHKNCSWVHIGRWLQTAQTQEVADSCFQQNKVQTWKKKRWCVVKIPLCLPLCWQWAEPDRRSQRCRRCCAPERAWPDVWAATRSKGGRKGKGNGLILDISMVEIFLADYIGKCFSIWGRIGATKDQYELVYE